MAAFDPAGWIAFAGAMVGASAALTGLVFVGISINLADILREPGLPERAFETLLILTGVLIASAVVLLPGSDPTILGVELLIVGGALAAIIGTTHLSALAHAQAQFRRQYWASLALNLSPAVCFAVAGIATAATLTGGLYWLGLGCLVGILAGVLNAWVLLVEIKR